MWEIINIRVLTQTFAAGTKMYKIIKSKKVKRIVSQI